MLKTKNKVQNVLFYWQFINKVVVEFKIEEKKILLNRL